MKKEQESANPLLPKDITVPDKQMITAKNPLNLCPLFIPGERHSHPLSLMITQLVLEFQILH